jgi:UDP-glucose 4-epimerase
VDQPTDVHLDYRDLAVLVTGGAGFIGSHLVDGLVERGATVTALDDLSAGRASNLDQARATLEGVNEKGRLRFIEGSILDEAALAEATRGADIVFHQAAIASVPRSVREPVRYLHMNMMGTLAVLEAAKAAGARRVVYAASSSAYGDQPGLPRRESMPADVRSPYAAAKISGEYLAQAMASTSDLETVSLRYFNIFGPRQRADSAYAAVIPLFCRWLMEGETPTIYGDGTQTRDFTYVANAVHANLLAGLAPGPMRGPVVNVATGRRSSVLELLEAVARELGVEVRYQLLPERAGEVRDSLADISDARALLGYEPVVPFEDGLATTVRAYAAGT